MNLNQKLILSVLLSILGERALLFTTLFLNFSLFAYAIIYPDYIRFATAGLFSITVFFPVLKIKGGGHVIPKAEDQSV